MNNNNNLLIKVCNTTLSDSTEKKEDFHYISMIESDITKYYKESETDETNYVGNFRIRLISNQDSKYKTKFDKLCNLEKYTIDMVAISNENNKHKGLMTIMICDILLTLFSREYAFKYNIVIHVRDCSKVYENNSKSEEHSETNVYKRVFPDYKGKHITSNTDRVESEVASPDFFYVFPLTYRKKDIQYYSNLKNKKLKILSKKL